MATPTTTGRRSGGARWCSSCRRCSWSLHWFAGPPRRTLGLLTGLAVDVVGLVVGLVVLGVCPPGLVGGALVVGVPFVVGAAAYGAVSTLDARVETV